MKISIISHAFAQTHETESPELAAKFRKSSRQMMLSYLAVERVLQPLSLSPEILKNMGIVLGTNHGELEVTKNFLKDLGNSNIARPILFQNSLHNSTLGFLSLNFGIQGPGLTTSHGQQSGEDAIEIALELIESSQCETCLVVGADDTVTEIDSVVTKLYPSGLTLTGGAGAILLANQNALEKIPRVANRAQIQKISFLNTDRQTKSSAYYDSNAIEALSKALTAGESFVRIPKPHGESIIELEIQV